VSFGGSRGVKGLERAIMLRAASAPRTHHELPGDLDAFPSRIVALYYFSILLEGIGFGPPGIVSRSRLGDDAVAWDIRWNKTLTDLASVHFPSNQSSFALAEGARDKAMFFGGGGAGGARNRQVLIWASTPANAGGAVPQIEMRRERDDDESTLGCSGRQRQG